MAVSKKRNLSKNIINNRKHKSKLLRYKKNQINQNGGVYESEREMFASVMPFMDAHPEVKTLIEKIFAGDNIKYFKLDGSMPDPFILKANERGFTPSFYLEWYKSKNPEFKTHVELQASGVQFNTNLGFDGSGDSIYETIIAQICRDICIMLRTGKRNINNDARDPRVFFQRIKNRDANHEKHTIAEEALTLLNKLPQTNNNKLKIKSAKNSLGLQTEENLVIENKEKFDSLILLLSQCNKCIANGYIYKDVFEIIMNYIKWISTRTKSTSDYFLELIDKYKQKYMQTPAIFFPTYAQISYKYVLCLISAPIINFRLSNRKRKVHNSFDTTIQDFVHDVNVHAVNTHIISLQTNKPTETYLSWNNSISSVIDILYPYFNYTKMSMKEIKELGRKRYDELEDEYKKQIIAILLFIFIHENLSIPSHLFYHLFNKTDYSKIVENFGKRQQPTTIENIYKYIGNTDDWPRNIDVASVVAALSSVFDKHRRELERPMAKLVQLIELNLPTQANM